MAHLKKIARIRTIIACCQSATQPLFHAPGIRLILSGAMKHVRWKIKINYPTFHSIGPATH